MKSTNVLGWMDVSSHLYWVNVLMQIRIGGSIRIFGAYCSVTA